MLRLKIISLIIILLSFHTTGCRPNKQINNVGAKGVISSKPNTKNSLFLSDSGANTQSGFAAGTLTNTVVDSTNGSLRLNDNSYGTFTSRVIASPGTTPSWQGIGWVTPLPFEKMIPDYGKSEQPSDYSSLVTGDQQNSIQGLWHLDETGTSFQDNSGNNYKGSAVGNGVSTVLGPFNNAVSLDGSSYISTNYTQSSLWAYTVSVWVQTQSKGGNYSAIFYDRGQQLKTDNGVGLTLGLGVDPTGVCGVPGGIYWEAEGASIGVGVGSTTTVNDGHWHHIVATWDSGVITGSAPVSPNQFKLFIDGVAQVQDSTLNSCATSSLPSYPLSGQDGALLGYHALGKGYYTGALDEVAVWNRALSQQEILQLYRRGANSIQFQVRSCAADPCLKEPWQGPDGTPNTFFTELNNTTDNAVTSTVLPQSVSINFNNFPKVSLPSQYFQYQVTMLSYDTQKQCPYGNCSPELNMVNVMTMSPDSGNAVQSTTTANSDTSAGTNDNSQTSTSGSGSSTSDSSSTSTSGSSTSDSSSSSISGSSTSDSSTSSTSDSSSTSTSGSSTSGSSSSSSSTSGSPTQTSGSPTQTPQAIILPSFMTGHTSPTP